MDTLTQSYRGVFEPLEADANRLVGETQFRSALKDQAALERSVPTVAAIDEMLSEKALETLPSHNSRAQLNA